MAKYIIFLDGELKGYLNDESSVRRAVMELADHLIAELRKSIAENIRIFSETIPDGVKIYSQRTGGYVFDGFVTQRHTILWKLLPEYEVPSLPSCNVEINEVEQALEQVD